MVAVKAGQAESFLKQADPRLEAYLLYGPDEGLVSERSQSLARRIAEREAPPGEIVRMSDADLDEAPDRIEVELLTAPMFGGRKIVRATAGRRINAALLKPLIEAGRLAGVLIVEGGNLRPDEGVRPVFEKCSTAAAIACFPDEARDIEGLIREVLSEGKLDISPEARAHLAARLGADRILSRSEIVKLALYVAGRPRIEVEDVDAIVGDASELALDKVVLAAVAGRVAEALAEHDRAVAAGEGPQTIILALQRHVQRLHRIRAALDAGRSLDEALRAIRPPLHFKQRDAVAAATRQWTTDRLLAAVLRVGEGLKSARLGGTLESAHAERLILEIGRLATRR
jgi:DNA polymerase-3 subunit delta